MVHKNSRIAAYALADHPPFDLKYVKTMAIQERFKEMKTPQELYAALPKATPLDQGVFLAPTANPGVFRFDVPLFRSIAKFEWDQLYNLPGKKDALQGSTDVAMGDTSAAALEIHEC